MNRFFILLFLFSSALLSGCTVNGNEQEEYLFSGQSEKWKVTYRADVEDKETEATVTYIGDEPVPDEDVVLVVEASFGFSEGHSISLENGVGKPGPLEAEHFSEISAEDTVIAEVRWGEESVNTEQREEISLTLKQ